MLEKDIENLIAQHPEEFFPHEGFTLIKQQYIIDGRRIDILFEDKHNRQVIIEVKRGILNREASGQISEYYGLLKSKNEERFYEMILCANVIPSERRLFLEHIGIDCKELGIAKISEIAKKYNYSFIDSNPFYQKEQSINVKSPCVTPSITPSQDDNDISVWIFQANPQKYDILNALRDEEIGNNIHWLINQHKTKIKKGNLGLIWMTGSESGIYALTRIDCDPQLMRENEAESKYWDSSQEDKELLRVKMTVLKRFDNNPILKKDLIKIDELKNMSIIRQPKGTNFPVTNQEWDIISQKI